MEYVVGMEYELTRELQISPRRGRNEVDATGPIELKIGPVSPLVLAEAEMLLFGRLGADLWKYHYEVSVFSAEDKEEKGMHGHIGYNIHQLTEEQMVDLLGIMFTAMALHRTPLVYIMSIGGHFRNSLKHWAKVSTEQLVLIPQHTSEIEQLTLQDLAAIYLDKMNLFDHFYTYVEPNKRRRNKPITIEFRVNENSAILGFLPFAAVSLGLWLKYRNHLLEVYREPRAYIERLHNILGEKNFWETSLSWDAISQLLDIYINPKNLGSDLYEVLNKEWKPFLQIADFYLTTSYNKPLLQLQVFAYEQYIAPLVTDMIRVEALEHLHDSVYINRMIQHTYRMKTIFKSKY